VLVSRNDFKSVVGQLSRSLDYGLDTETTGLSLSDRLFSIILADEHQSYYFNFLARADHRGTKPPLEYILPNLWLSEMASILDNPESSFYIHNAKFDMAMLAKEDLYISGDVHCTLAMERVLRNNYLKYDLESCAARRGLMKDGAVEEYIKKNKLITKSFVPGKAKAYEKWHFDQVPFDIISVYGENDARLHRAIGRDQLTSMAALEAARPVIAPSYLPLMENEKRLTKACFKMEQAGIKIDRRYTQEAMTFTMEKAKVAVKEFTDLTGVGYDDSAAVFKEAFKRAGIDLPLTKTGRPSTAKDVLDSLENPIADKIREIRTLEKLCSTYFSSFLHYADSDDLIHANIRQGGTETGRFSYSDPNLQNLPKEDEEDDRDKPYHVRRCFVPRNADRCFVPIDFKQQEFRMMLDYAGELELIDAVNQGQDVHDATAELMGVPRKFAKTLNFGLLYGMGAPKLAKNLKISLSDSYELRALYFSKMPRVQKLIRGVMNTGEKRGYIWNWFGFHNHLSSPEYAYVLPNHLIQGGCAQVIRIALVRLDEFIVNNKLSTDIVCQVHDEILFEVPRNELQYVPILQATMEGVYKGKNGMRLDCSVEHSWKSWGKFDQQKGCPV
jgi:DNA polymerase-1